jgi:hypothetical protein
MQYLDAKISAIVSPLPSLIPKFLFLLSGPKHVPKVSPTPANTTSSYQYIPHIRKHSCKHHMAYAHHCACAPQSMSSIVYALCTCIVRPLKQDSNYTDATARTMSSNSAVQA